MSRKRCTKGKSCGYSCINRTKICRVELGRDPSTSLGRVAREGIGQRDEARTTPRQPTMKFRDGNLVVGRETFSPGKTLEGSTMPTLFVDRDGKGRWVVKEGGAKGQNLVEKASNDVYGILGKSLGTGAVDSNLVDGKLVNRFIEGGRTINTLSSGERRRLDVDGHMRRSHIADALVGNWDYMGALKGDNVMVDPQGKVTRIDAGGTFNYRAQGASKSYGPIPVEMWSLRRGQGKGIWADATDADYRHLWTDQVRALRNSARELKGAVDTSGMRPEVARAFSQRMASLIMAGNLVSTTRIGGQTIQQLADSGRISWSQVDRALGKAFDNASSLPAGAGWGKALRSEILSNLQDLV